MSVTQYLKDIMNWSCTEDYSHMVMFIMCLINVQKIIAVIDATFAVAKIRQEKMSSSHLFQEFFVQLRCVYNFNDLLHINFSSSSCNWYCMIYIYSKNL